MDDSAEDVAVYGNGIEIVDEDATPSTVDNTYFMTFLVSGDTTTHTFRIKNTAVNPVAVGPLTTNGTHAADFIVLSQPVSPIPVNGYSDVQIRFDPNAQVRGKQRLILQTVSLLRIRMISILKVPVGWLRYL